MDEIHKVNNYWQSKQKEDSPAKCGHNFNKRIGLINPNKLPWTIALFFESHDPKLCICGQTITNSYLITNGKEQVLVGATCINKVNKKLFNFNKTLPSYCTVCDKEIRNYTQHCESETHQVKKQVKNWRLQNLMELHVQYQNHECTDCGKFLGKDKPLFHKRCMACFVKSRGIKTQFQFK